MSWRLNRAMLQTPPPGGPDSDGGRFARSWRMTKASLQVVRGDRTLIWLALVQTAFGFAGGAAIFWLSGGADGDGSTPGVAFWALVLSLPLTFATVFLGVALTSAANARLQGQNPSLRAALGVALRRLPQIVVWSALSTVIGILIRELIERLPFGGKLAAWLAGVAWSLATMFVVPILALEGCTAFDCVKRSAGTFRKRWGEGVSGGLIIGAWTVLLTIPACLAIGVGAALESDGRSGAPWIAAGVTVLFGMAALVAVVRQTFELVLYRYALGLAAPPHFAEGDLENPLRRKSGRSGDGDAPASGARESSPSLPFRTRVSASAASSARSRNFKAVVAGLVAYAIGLVINSMVDGSYEEGEPAQPIGHVLASDGVAFIALAVVVFFAAKRLNERRLAGSPRDPTALFALGALFQLFALGRLMVGDMYFTHDERYVWLLMFGFACWLGSAIWGVIQWRATSRGHSVHAFRAWAHLLLAAAAAALFAATLT